MRKLIYYFLLATCAMALLPSCEHEEPVDPIKPLEKRTVLVLTYNGEIYDQTGKLVKQLPNCVYASEIISDGDDYFVSGVPTKERVGYWKNGKWTTLHVDFIEDVDHWIYGMGKWDSYIYLLDLPNVLKNSGIFPLEDCEHFTAVDRSLRVSEGKCYVIGSEPANEDESVPVLYSNRNKDTFKKEYLPMPPGAKSGECRAIYAYDRNYTVIGGIIDRLPAVWVDKQYKIYEISAPELLEEGSYPIGRIESITMAGGHIYAAGFEYDENQRLTATVWTDGILKHYMHNDKIENMSQTVAIYSYGDDVYLLTSEYDEEIGDAFYLWLNGEVIMSYPGDIGAIDFTVL